MNFIGKKSVWRRLLNVLLVILFFLVGCELSDNGNAAKDYYSEIDVKNSVIFNGVEHGMGWIPESQAEYDALPKLKVSATVSLPSSIDLSSSMPNVRDQGIQNSCAGWAVAYAYKTYQEKLDWKWNVINDPTHQFSPSYVYNQINGGSDNGSYLPDAMRLMVNQGCATLSSMPYNQNDCWTQPTTAQRTIAAKHKALSWTSTNSGDVTAMKNSLASRVPVIVGIPVYPDFNVTTSNPVYDNTNGNLEGYHAITLVGYNDTRQAFKFINSWGTSYGFNGYGWIAYVLVAEVGGRGYTMIDIKDATVPIVTTLTMSKSVYAVNETIRVNYSGVTAGSKNWIGLYKSGAANKDFLTMKYIPSENVKGSLVFRGRTSAGTYAVRLFYNANYTLIKRAVFTVK